MSMTTLLVILALFTASGGHERIRPDDPAHGFHACVDGPCVTGGRIIVDRVEVQE